MAAALSVASRRLVEHLMQWQLTQYTRAVVLKCFGLRSLSTPNNSLREPQGSEVHTLRNATLEHCEIHQQIT